MNPFSWQWQNLCLLSLAFIIDWRVVSCILRLEAMFGSSVGLASTLKKVATDQLVMAPFMSFGIINLVAFSQGKRKIEDFRSQLEEQYVEVLINGWRLWPVSFSNLEIFLLKIEHMHFI